MELRQKAFFLTSHLDFVRGTLEGGSYVDSQLNVELGDVYTTFPRLFGRFFCLDQ